MLLQGTVRWRSRFFCLSFEVKKPFRSKHLDVLLHPWCVLRTTSLVCLALAALTSCSRQKPLSRDELQTKLRSAESIAAETGTFIEYVRQKRATRQYASGHIEYLSSEIGRIANELHASLPPADGAPEFSEGRKQVVALAAELSELRGLIGHPDELAREQDRIAAIRNALQQAVSSL